MNLLSVGGDNIAHQSYAKCSKATMNWVFHMREGRGEEHFHFLAFDDNFNS